MTHFNGVRLSRRFVLLSSSALFTTTIFRLRPSLADVTADLAARLRPSLFGPVNAPKFATSASDYQPIRDFLAHSQQGWSAPVSWLFGNKILDDNVQYSQAMAARLNAANDQMSDMYAVLKTSVSAFSDRPPTVEVLAPSFSASCKGVIGSTGITNGSVSQEYAASIVLSALSLATDSDPSLSQRLSSATADFSINWEAPIPTLISGLPTNVQPAINSFISISNSISFGASLDATTTLALAQSLTGALSPNLNKATGTLIQLSENVNTAIQAFDPSSFETDQDNISSAQYDVQSTCALAKTVAGVLFPGAAETLDAVTKVATTAVNVANVAIGAISGAFSLTSGVGEIGAALDGISSLLGGSLFGGPSPEVAMLDQIQKQIQTLGAHLDQRFDRLEVIDDNIINLIKSIGQDLQDVENQLQTVLQQIADLKEAISFTDQEIKLVEIEGSWKQLLTNSSDLQGDIDKPDLTTNHLDHLVNHAVYESNASYFNGTFPVPMTEQMFGSGQNPTNGTLLPPRVDQRFGALVQARLGDDASNPNTRNFVEWARGTNTFCDAVLSYGPSLVEAEVADSILHLWNAGVGFRSTLSQLFDPHEVADLIQRIKGYLGVPDSGDASGASDFINGSFLQAAYNTLSASETNHKSLTSFTFATYPGPQGQQIGGNTYRGGTAFLEVVLPYQGSEDPLETAIRENYITQTTLPLIVDGIFQLQPELLQYSAGPLSGTPLINGVSSSMFGFRVDPTFNSYHGNNPDPWGITFISGSIPSNIFTPPLQLINPETILNMARELVWEVRDFPGFISNAQELILSTGDLSEAASALSMADALVALANMNLTAVRTTLPYPTTENWFSAGELPVSPWLGRSGLPSTEQEIRKALGQIIQHMVVPKPDISVDYSLVICNAFSMAISTLLDSAQTQIEKAGGYGNPIFERAVVNLATLATIYGVALPQMS